LGLLLGRRGAFLRGLRDLVRDLLGGGGDLLRAILRGIRDGLRVALRSGRGIGGRIIRTRRAEGREAEDQ
jgi:hypothetical protein